MERCFTAECAIGTAQPAVRCFVISNIVFGESYDSSETIEAIGLESCKSTFAASLQTPRREIKAGCEFFQCDAGVQHEFFDNRVRKAGPKNVQKIILFGDLVPQDRWSTHLFDHSMELINHSVVYCSAN